MGLVEIVKCEGSHMSLRDTILESQNQLRLIRDISVLPSINSRKVKKAIRSYVPGRDIGSNLVLLLIDNTILRSGKQGMIITQEMLYSFSNISGKFSIPLKEIESVSPQVRRALGNPQFGIVVNGEVFLSLPGLTENNSMIRDFIEWEGVLVGSELTPAIIYFSIFLHKTLQCKLILEKEPEPGPPPWYND